MTVDIDMEFDGMRLSKNEVIFNVKRALDDYFNRFDNEYEEDALRVVAVYENTTVVSGGHKA
jgi:hypothetical protein